LSVQYLQRIFIYEAIVAMATALKRKMLAVRKSAQEKKINPENKPNKPF
jgi:hypothetical protein